ncbi:MAG: aminotransferase class I/II-fold pyridoxal phosphate-dependent enzyme [Deinococcales bacterium]|jgi:aspartate/methionine/tyrosine aminotransferase|nr:aminotransferase class I/II-fold pyridoxal phosphate-dependent enzyme [Deinococcales bacterium]|tara:strand:- start:18457 stop:19647 length:1191 start_codon:yes stop_codon:yes gene_type:complete
MEIRTASRVNDLFESVIRSTSVHAMSCGAISLGQGSPDFDPPEELIEAARLALSEGHHQYVPTWGLPELRNAISKKTARFYGFQPDPETEVTVTCGVTEGVIAALIGVVDKGDRVVILEPAHENYHAGVVFAGAEPLWVPIRPPDYGLDLDELERAFQQPKVRAFIFNTPHNPTGRVFNREELSFIADLCQKYGVIAISDEIYEHMVYDDCEHIPIVTLPGMADRTITISGLSKSYSVTGWRVGYVTAPSLLTEALRKVHDFTTICAPSPLQRAAVVALELNDDYYAWLTAYYADRRDQMLGILTRSGFEPSVPEGSYYTMATFSAVSAAFGLNDDDNEFVYWLIDEIGIGTVPGSSFYRSDPELGRGRVRFAFPKRDETLIEVDQRFEKIRDQLH